MIKQNGIDILKNLLLEKINGDRSIELIQKIIENTDNQKEITKLNSIYRLFRIKNDIDNGKSSWEDFLANLRQIMLYYKIELPLSKGIIDQIKNKYSKFNLFLYENQQIIKVLHDKYPNWFLNKDSKDLKVINELYELKERRIENKQIGDGILYEMTGFTHYISKHQKAIVQASMEMPEGYTLLGCLPTGGGKSLAALLPAYFDNEGGTIGAMIEKAGVNIVVVPTVALALDQVNNARDFFKKARSEKYKPQAYHGGLSKKEKKNIFEGLRNGTIPLLFTSPEALMTGILNEIILEVAKSNKINRLIIDESHIVGSWGNIFRTEFQMLSILQKKLYKFSEGKLKTLLLSATITDNTADLLKDLFVIKDNLIEMRGDKLRPEPSFWLDKNYDKEKRFNKILKLLNLLPRPLILYVTKVEDAQEWYRRLTDFGYKDIATFTGQTNKNRRKNLLRDWADNKIDIMISTSAFGLGVDKKDVRTIIHCCLPESIDRYYQEVGRAGRDGYPSISILSTYYNDYDDQNDYKIAKYLIDKILTTNNLVDRWMTMYNNPVINKSGDEILVDTDVSPPHLEDKITGMRNANWNEVTILFFYRNGLIDIQNINKTDRTYQFEVKLKNIDILMNRDSLRSKISELREREQKDSYREYKNMKDLLNKSGKSCWGNDFSRIYSYTYLVCGGCPYCRRKGEFFNRDIESDIYINNLDVLNQKQEFKLIGKIEEYNCLNRELIIDYSIKDEKYYKLVKELVESNIRNIVFPSKIDEEEWNKFLKYLPGSESNYYKTFKINEILNFKNRYVIFGPTAIYYPKEEKYSIKVFNWSRNYLNKDIKNHLTHIVSKDLTFANSTKEIKDRIEGDWVKINNIISSDSDDFETWL